MRLCRHQGYLACTEPHLKCEACPVHQGLLDVSRKLLEPRGVLDFTPPDPHIYVSGGSPSGAPCFGIEIGIKKTF